MKRTVPQIHEGQGRKHRSIGIRCLPSVSAFKPLKSFSTKSVLSSHNQRGKLILETQAYRGANSVFSILLYSQIVFKLHRNREKCFSANAHKEICKKVNALISRRAERAASRVCCFCLSISRVFPDDVTNNKLLYG